MIIAIVILFFCISILKLITADYFDDILIYTKNIYHDLRLKRDLPVWWKYRKLHKTFDTWSLYDIENNRNYLSMCKDEYLVRVKFKSLTEYFDNTLEYLKVLEPNKSIEDRKKFELLKKDFFNVNKELSLYVSTIQEKIKNDSAIEFQKEIHLLKE